MGTSEALCPPAARALIVFAVERVVYHRNTIPVLSQIAPERPRAEGYGIFNPCRGQAGGVTGITDTGAAARDDGGMDEPFVFVEDVKAVVPVPENGTLSRTLYQDERVKVIGFGFAAGQELSAHTAPMPAILQFVEGEIDLTLAGEKRQAKPGTLVRMAPKCEHSLKAKTPATVVLYLLKQ
jgi:quercetin dioxygenase-like cupin family protein